MLTVEQSYAVANAAVEMFKEWKSHLSVAMGAFLKINERVRRFLPDLTSQRLSEPVKAANATGFFISEYYPEIGSDGRIGKFKLNMRLSAWITLPILGYVRADGLVSITYETMKKIIQHLRIHKDVYEGLAPVEMLRDAVDRHANDNPDGVMQLRKVFDHALLRNAINEWLPTFNKMTEFVEARLARSRKQNDKSRSLLKAFGLEGGDGDEKIVLPRFELKEVKNVH